MRGDLNVLSACGEALRAAAMADPWCLMLKVCKWQCGREVEVSSHRQGSSAYLIRAGGSDPPDAVALGAGAK